MITKGKIIKYSKEIGIDLIGFVKAEVFKELRDMLKKREEKNYLSGFEEKSIEKRINPYLTLENVETIIVIGIPYFIDEADIEQSKSCGNVGNISRSSWGKDYHIVLKEKMKSLTEYIAAEDPDFKYKYFTDTGPLVDRYLAYRAGIGWYGRNNCIISYDYGSWIFIGYILCNLKIKPDDSLKTRCINCNKCINSCPTGALMKNNIYNSKLCISYLTQTKEDIKYELREKMGNSLYGCDICQLVCPHNRKRLAGNKDFIPKKNSSKPDLLDLLKLSNEQFKKEFGDTALAWRGNRIMKRNALIALGNCGSQEVIDHLVEYLNNPSIMIKKYCAWAIIRLNKDKGKKILNEHLKKEKEREVIDEILKLYKYYL
ncbi:tRNA epoxyqueuosine(34) reductase QueG [Paramaledivibacter caminithermalis]|jgi:epoxyqueuosine reductase|uniref:Epoxyqueuosine reductase n=1 Tax=Paramaledivibacter caminithermalis (strain DSM 15212 / CIP 107654 / DViRD3) TaxID=1121301 RepID=A0A1M6MMD4_PARC5|nr:tRNA epoxyqueuosine(34) reductase QueG [Paramaledivibacter caminithermalis]SHJ84655.1 epoxyqueuosine reductase [Paramaledivibacter caminithermalis DSM 15212]